LVRFAPWAWDNTKLMVWAWLAAAPIVYRTTLALLPLSARIPLFVLLFFSGSLTLADGLASRHSYSLAKRSELANVSAVLREVPLSTRLLTSPEYAQPASLLGWPVFLGYDGHLWSHGYDYQVPLDRLNRLARGQEASFSPGSLFLIGPMERARWGDINLEPNWQLEKASGNFQLWRKVR
jgi:hypothetical protein